MVKAGEIHGGSHADLSRTGDEPGGVSGVLLGKRGGRAEETGTERFRGAAEQNPIDACQGPASLKSTSLGAFFVITELGDGSVGTSEEACEGVRRIVRGGVESAEVEAGPRKTVAKGLQNSGASASHMDEAPELSVFLKEEADGLVSEAGRDQKSGRQMKGGGGSGKENVG